MAGGGAGRRLVKGKRRAWMRRANVGAGFSSGTGRLASERVRKAMNSQRNSVGGRG